MGKQIIKADDKIEEQSRKEKGEEGDKERMGERKRNNNKNIEDLEREKIGRKAKNLRALMEK